MHANNSKYLGIYFKVQVTKSITSNKRWARSAAVHQGCTLLLGMNWPIDVKTCLGYIRDKCIMNVKCITISFLFEDLPLIFFLMWTGFLNGINVTIKTRSHLIIINFYVTLQEENGIYIYKLILNHHHHPKKDKRSFSVLRETGSYNLT